MNSKILCVLASIMLIACAYGQKTSIELSFTANENAIYTQLDMIKVTNLSQGGDTSLYYPDTVLVLEYPAGTDHPGSQSNNFSLFQNYPNPAGQFTTISMYVPERDEVGITVADVAGRMLLQRTLLLDKGTHVFRFIPGGGKLSVLTAHWRGSRYSIKIVQTAENTNGVCQLEYKGNHAPGQSYKNSLLTQGFPFFPGDSLLIVGYIDTLQSGTLDSPEANQAYTLQFAYGIACPGTPTVDYGGQVYNTVQIFDQCWLKENLNIGIMVPGDSIMKDDGEIEKYCYNNQADSCNSFGGLYQWHELMQYTEVPASQGICPPGWHVPTDLEWKILEGAVDSEFGIGDPEWDGNMEFRGLDAGAHLKDIDHWYPGSPGTDKFDFSTFGGGACTNLGNFYWILSAGYYWTSSYVDFNHMWARRFDYDEDEVYREDEYKGMGLSVRCVKD